MIFFHKDIFEYLSNYIIFFSKFEKGFMSIVPMKNRDLYLKFLLFAIFIIFYKKLQFHDFRLSLFIALYSLVVIVGFWGFSMPTLKRLTYYFELPSIIIIGSIPYIFNGSFNILFSKIIVYFFAITYFVLVYYIIGSSEIFPYNFR